jgi:hypothetical protein
MLSLLQLSLGLQGRHTVFTRTETNGELLQQRHNYNKQDSKQNSKQNSKQGAGSEVRNQEELDMEKKEISEITGRQRRHIVRIMNRRSIKQMVRQMLHPGLKPPNPPVGQGAQVGLEGFQVVQGAQVCLLVPQRLCLWPLTPLGPLPVTHGSWVSLNRN